MEANKRGGRANRYQRDARHARRAPSYGRYGNSLARESDHTGALLALLAALMLLMACTVGFEDEGFIEAHSKWEADLKEQGAWVMW